MPRTVARDISGERFGKLLVIRRDDIRNRNGKALWVCQCDCGVIKSITGDNLRNHGAKSCGCSRIQHRIDKLFKTDSGFKALLRHYERIRKLKNLEFSLTEDEFGELTSGNCYYCNDEPSRIVKKTSKKGAYTYNGIDRLNNSEGYVTGNCVTCCTRCNFFKSGKNYGDFMSHIKKIYYNQIIKDQEFWEQEFEEDKFVWPFDFRWVKEDCK